MVFWIAILAGGFFTWLAIRMGFYATWALLFNVVVSIYVAVFLTPLVARFAPASSYGVAFSMIVLAVACFAILHGLSYVFLTGQFNVRFPRFFEILLAGALGFAVGFLILSFVGLVVTTTPLARNRLGSSFALDPEARSPNLSGLAWCCDRIHGVVGFDGQGQDSATQKAVASILEMSERMAPIPETADPNELADTPAKPPPSRRNRVRDPVGDMESL
ncbi:MAG: CvpA family protein [Sedimentisphaerales bacterium]|nr:CvpA family protein [Sedimentisphaerales bacterium]